MKLLVEFCLLAAEEAGWKTEFVNEELDIYIPDNFEAEVCKLFKEYVCNFTNITEARIYSGNARIVDVSFDVAVNFIRGYKGERL